MVLSFVQLESHLTPCGPFECFCAINSVKLLIKQRNVMRKRRNWERQLAAKKSKRKEEKQRRKLSREQESGKYQMKRIICDLSF